MDKEVMKPTDVAQSAERQLFNLTKAQNDKMREVLNQREYIASLKRVIQSLIYAAGTTYQTVFPGASGFIEGRIKSPDSITTKTRNEFTEILNKIEEDPNINQQKILDEISKISFKDLIAFSVITTTPPETFRTGSDELNAKLNGLAAELDITSRRLNVHKEYIERKEQTVLDITKIGAEHTKRIEGEVRIEYQEIDSLEDLKEKEPEEYAKFKMYEEKLKEELQAKFGDNLLTKGKVKDKVKSEFNSLKENLIQRKIEDRINQEIDIFSDSDFVKNKIKNSEELTRIYDQELKKLEATNKEKTDIEHIARKRVVYYVKEKEIAEYAKTAVPMFFRANLQPNEEVMVYWFSTGESLYRYFYNKLNGLKDENGKYKYEPQEQQKKALLRLTGLFEEDCSNFYTYNKNNETFGGLER